MIHDDTQGMPMAWNRDYLILTYWFGTRVIKLQGDIFVFKHFRSNWFSARWYFNTSISCAIMC